MPIIEGTLQTDTEVAAECADLAAFSCGDGRLPAAEDDVNAIVAELHGGDYPDAVLRVTREMPVGTLVGIAAIEPRKGPIIDHPVIPEKDNEDAAYVVVLTLSGGYRGSYTCKDGRPLSEVLVLEALRYLVTENDGAIPPVQAVIARANTPSREMVERYGFVNPIETIGDRFYIRARNLPLPSGTAGTVP